MLLRSAGAADTDLKPQNCQKATASAQIGFCLTYKSFWIEVSAK